MRRRTFLKAAAGVVAGARLAQGPRSSFPKIEQKLMITPQQAWD